MRSLAVYVCAYVCLIVITLSLAVYVCLCVCMLLHTRMLPGSYTIMKSTFKHVASPAFLLLDIDVIFKVKLLPYHILF